MSLAHHNYAGAYARHLKRYLPRGEGVVILEVGVLRGSGLAIWCDMFPDAKVIGCDIDLSNTLENMENLRSLGAFTNNTPILLEFDAYLPDTAGLERILSGQKIAVVIDDGPHTIEAIEATAKALKPYLADDYTYFVEDNRRSLESVVSVLQPRRVFTEAWSEIIVLQG